MALVGMAPRGPSPATVPKGKRFYPPKKMGHRVLSRHCSGQI